MTKLAITLGEKELMELQKILLDEDQACALRFLKTRQVLKMLAPYLAVGLFWCVFANAWVTILVYHAQILLWSRGSLEKMRWTARISTILLALPSVLAGPLVYWLLPHMSHTDLSAWLESHHLSGVSFMLMIPYFGLVHPFLEQLHWAPLRESTPVSHIMFAGYHVMVLYSLVTAPWLIFCFAVLVAASLMWHWMATRRDGLASVFVSHALADTGIIVAATLRIQQVVS